MKLDLEVICQKIEDTLKEKMNDKLAQIDSEKCDFELDKINSDAYIFQSLDDRVANYNPWVYYGILAAPSIASNTAVAKSPQIEITVVLADAQDKNIHRRLFRYQRALEEIFTESMFPIKGLKEKVKVTNLEPVAFKLQNNTSEFKAIGVIIELDLFS